ncbi:MAG TPA: ANTAR domain-containing protein [Pseudonocardia sp.]
MERSPVEDGPDADSADAVGCSEIVSFLTGSVVFHQATGVVMWRLGIGAEQARSYLRAQSRAAARGVFGVARDVVDGRLEIRSCGLVER